MRVPMYVIVSSRTFGHSLAQLRDVASYQGIVELQRIR